MNREKSGFVFWAWVVLLLSFLSFLFVSFHLHDTKKKRELPTLSLSMTNHSDLKEWEVACGCQSSFSFIKFNNNIGWVCDLDPNFPSSLLSPKCGIGCGRREKKGREDATDEGTNKNENEQKKEEEKEEEKEEWKEEEEEKEEWKEEEEWIAEIILCPEGYHFVPCSGCVWDGSFLELEHSICSSGCLGPILSFEEEEGKDFLLVHEGFYCFADFSLFSSSSLREYCRSGCSFLESEGRVEDEERGEEEEEEEENEKSVKREKLDRGLIIFCPFGFQPDCIVGCRAGQSSPVYLPTESLITSWPVQEDTDDFVIITASPNNYRFAYAYTQLSPFSATFISMKCQGHLSPTCLPDSPSSYFLLPSRANNKQNHHHHQQQPTLNRNSFSSSFQNSGQQLRYQFEHPSSPLCPCEIDVKNRGWSNYLDYMISNTWAHLHFTREKEKNSSKRKVEEIETLLLGIGAFVPTFLSLFPFSSIDVIELSPEMVAISTAYFGVPPNLSLSLLDCYDGVLEKREQGKKYDAIFVDVFVDCHVPLQCRSYQFYEAIGHLLEEDGIVCQNIWQSALHFPEIRFHFFEAFEYFHSLFENVTTWSNYQYDENSVGSLVVLCGSFPRKKVKKI